MIKSKKIEELISSAERFDSDPNVGLSASLVEQRQKEGLTNKKKKQVTKSYFRILIDNIFNFLNILLFAVFILMLIAKIKTLASYFFMGVSVSNMIIGLLQDIHARRLVDKLRVITDPKAKVVRDGEIVTIPTSEVVLDDILYLASGDQICADGVLVLGHCSVDESLLSGESNPIKKVPGDTLLSGTYLTKGEARIRVSKVGHANYAETLQEKAGEFSRPKSEIKRSVNGITLVCGIIAVIFGVIMTLNQIIGPHLGLPAKSFHDFVGSMSGSMVAMIPTGMFLLTSVSLAVGVIALARKRMLVQQLYCIEMLARVDVLCLDKTGTLTDGSMMVHRVVPFGNYTESDIHQAVSSLLAYTHDNNATARALRAKFGASSSDVLLHALPFDSENKLSAITLQGKGTFILGAYEFIRAKKDLNIEAKINEYARLGYRCVVLSRSKKPIENDYVPRDSEIMGLIVLSDHIKEDAAKNIAWFVDNGVMVRVISGDNPITVSEIAKRVGVPNADKYISLEGVSLEETAKLAMQYSIFGRVSPEQKAVLVNAYKAAGHKVAMTGDGVNDILALKVADCSIAMASGSEAARSVSHLVALDSDFSRLPDVVAQGRRVINNLQRTCSLFLSKTIFAITVTLIFTISTYMGSSPYPYTTANLLIWEVCSIGMAAFFLALQPSNDRLKGSFIGNIIYKAVPAGIVEIIAAMVPFIIYLINPSFFASSPEPSATVRWVSVMTFSIFSFVVLFRVCWPFTRYRAFVFGGMSLFAIAIFVLDYFFRGPLPGKEEFAQGKLIHIYWDGQNPKFYLTILFIILGCSAVYAAVYLLMGKLFKEKEGKTDYEN